MTTKPRIYKLSVMVPSPYLEPVKEALFSAGAGGYGRYDKCCWQTRGCGQFRPLNGSQPFTGEQGKVHQEETWKVEMICPEALLPAAIAALHRAHPYEVPAYDFFPVSISLPDDLLRGSPTPGA